MYLNPQHENLAVRHHLRNLGLILKLISKKRGVMVWAVSKLTAITGGFWTQYVHVN